jgi:DnaJ-class molecular chaperone
VSSPDLPAALARIRELEAAVRILGACPRCKGEGKVTYHGRGCPSELGECDRCGGSGFLPGAAAVLVGVEGQP